ncbi:MAG: 2'-5' RNA ligase [Elusimicrobia bacterium RIFOXYA2_FULL_58_8]|nr:MAG: 2'-5' RNA ligase [Elusimicrobia bacterium RIFOXYA12_FULL_57_11]OGS16985.1 MAG: 2'-5' RNA ligase [Elusimicrobia bacterium RIFOXYA2_FULL_58_8]
MRLFLASGFSAAVIARVRELQTFAAPHLGGTVKWVEPDNIHLTYAFLGEVPGDRAQAAIKSAERCAGLFKQIEVRLNGLGAFPSLERPAVLWLGLAESSPGSLKTLAQNLSAALAEEGFMPDLKFEPHITIGRLKAPPAPGITGELRSKAAELAAASVITSVEVLESRLGGAGPKYKILNSTRLL